jgi:CheY-like chemotaxis protein
VAPKQVVVVEDDYETRMLVGELLVLEGYQVIPCARGELAYETIRRESPDLAIVDLMLGGPEEGWLILTLLRSDPATAHLPIILCSANVGFLRRRGPLLRRRGCVALEKPFDREGLLGAIGEAFALHPAREFGA